MQADRLTERQAGRQAHRQKDWEGSQMSGGRMEIRAEGKMADRNKQLKRQIKKSH